MKGIGGYLLFFGGLAATVGNSVASHGDTAWWAVLLELGAMGWGLDLIIEEKVEQAKAELREEMQSR